MTFEVKDYHDLVRLLHEHPEWREELRHLLLSPEVLELPQALRDLIEAQRELTEIQKRSEQRIIQIDERLAALEERFIHLDERQAAVEERFIRIEERQAALEERQIALEERQAALEERFIRLEERQAALEERQIALEERQAALEERQVALEERMAALEERQAALEERFIRLEERQAALEERMAEVEERLIRLEQRQVEVEERLTRLEHIVAELVAVQKRHEEQLYRLNQRVNEMTDDIGELRGDMLEIRYRQRAFSYFGKIVSRAQVVDLQEIWSDKIEPVLTEDERDELLSLDLLVRGQLKRSLEEQTGKSELWLAIEVSGTVDRNDVKRARRRADLLEKAGLPVLPVAAGRTVTEGAVDVARDNGVLLQMNGVLLHLEEALKWLSGSRQN